MLVEQSFRTHKDKPRRLAETFKPRTLGRASTLWFSLTSITLRARREGTCLKLLGGHNYDKPVRDMFLLLPCFEGVNARNNIGRFCACIEPFFRRASRAFTQLFLLCDKVSQPLNKLK